MDTINLGTSLPFTPVDFRGKSGFPSDDNGYVFWYTHPVPNSKRDKTYVVRTDHTNEGWRVDYIPVVGPIEATYGPNRESYWPTKEEAAAALEWSLTNG